MTLCPEDRAERDGDRERPQRVLVKRGISSPSKFIIHVGGWLTREKVELKAMYSKCQARVNTVGWLKLQGQFSCCSSLAVNLKSYLSGMSGKVIRHKD